MATREYLSPQEWRSNLTDYTCNVCNCRQAERPVCHLYVGSIKEAVKWATDQDYLVEEVECRAMRADACRFMVKIE